MTDINQTLQQRGERYGEFADTAAAAQDIKDIFAAYDCQNRSSHHNEALDLIATKLARIITGDPDYSDNWHDIAGYATLVEQEIARLQQLEAQGEKLAEKIKQHKENQNV